jgi:urocanate hydratase
MLGAPSFAFFAKGGTQRTSTLQQTWYFRQSVGWNPMPLDLTPRFTFALQVERLYTALLQAVHSGLSSEPGLGGKLLYAGELDGQGRALLVAGNIAGAASLAATAGQVAQKQAIRDGVADFLVTSLDEALRILKNEIRKGETVAVCVAAGPEAIEREMLERGVLPDLLAANPLGGAAFPNQGARRIEPCGRKEEQVLLRWSVASAQALWLPKLDAMALDCLGPEDRAAPRWLRLAPRYLGRLAQGVRVLTCAPESAREFVTRVQQGVKHGEIGVEVRFSLNSHEETDLPWSSPPDALRDEG